MFVRLHIILRILSLGSLVHVSLSIGTGQSYSGHAGHAGHNQKVSPKYENMNYTSCLAKTMPYSCAEFTTHRFRLYYAFDLIQFNMF